MHLLHSLHMSGQANTSLVSEFILLGLSQNPDLHLPLFCLFTGLYIVTLGGNLLIITLIRTDPRLHKPMYFFLENLSFLDFLLISVTVPKMLDNLVKNKQSISFTGCISQIHFYQVFMVAECFILAIMAYDRYLAICQPLRYPLVMTRCALDLLVASCWIIGLAYSFAKTTLMLNVVFCGPNVLNSFFCDAPPLFELACSDTSDLDLFQFTAGVFVGPFPAMTVVVSYIPIIYAIIRIKSAQGRTKTFSTCASHLVVVALFYGSGIFSYVIRPRISQQNQMDLVVTVTYAVIAPMLNPFIYSLRNKEMLCALKRLFRQKNV
ncbi:olfactory receptor 151-like [Spea bombifrons]|uniref:olfactory receptor 151-like n=1 Tax=Spea bombifrons TaxID=233779 RepID=UPI002349ABCB|nr:olfactory receptor 151-like [Spea bombifrons]